MTDLQVKYQSLMEDKRKHDAEIDELKARTIRSKTLLPTEHFKLMNEANLIGKEVDWYDGKTASEIYKNITTGTGSFLKGLFSI